MKRLKPEGRRFICKVNHVIVRVGSDDFVAMTPEAYERHRIQVDKLDATGQDTETSTGQDSHQR
jgi:hypothetical protein